MPSESEHFASLAGQRISSQQDQAQRLTVKAPQLAGVVAKIPGRSSLKTGALGRNRTYDQEIRRLLLYPLSYEGRLRILTVCFP